MHSIMTVVQKNKTMSLYPFGWAGKLNKKLYREFVSEELENHGFLGDELSIIRYFESPQYYNVYDLVEAYEIMAIPQEIVFEKLSMIDYGSIISICPHRFTYRVFCVFLRFMSTGKLLDLLERNEEPILHPFHLTLDMLEEECPENTRNNVNFLRYLRNVHIRNFVHLSSLEVLNENITDLNIFCDSLRVLNVRCNSRIRDEDIRELHNLDTLDASDSPHITTVLPFWNLRFLVAEGNCGISDKGMPRCRGFHCRSEGNYLISETSCDE